MSLINAAAAGFIFLAAGMKAGIGLEAAKKPGEGTVLYAGPGSRFGLLFYASAAACFSWVIADSIWLYELNSAQDPTQNLASAFWYLAPNAVFCAAVLALALRQNGRWRSVKSIFLSVSVGLLGVMLVWIVQFNGRETAFYAQDIDGLFTLILIGADIFVLVQAALLFISLDKKTRPPFLVLLLAGFFVFAGTDLACVVCGYRGAYNALYILGGLYILSFWIAASGAVLYAVRQDTLSRISYRDIGMKCRWICLPAFPAAAMLLRGFSIVNLYIYGVVIGLIEAALYFMRLSEETEKLLKAERETAARYTDRLEELNTELTMLRSCDTATKLYNRRYFNNCLEKAIRFRNNENIAVIQFDIDRFKTINESYGHDFGDKVIVEISRRLLEWNRCGAVLARLSGDEFAVMLQGPYTRYDIGEYCKQIIEICNAPIFLDSQVLYITVSAGISLCPNDAGDGVTLMKNSDIAMFRAKAEGYNRYVFYTPAFKENILRKNEIEALLRKADLENDFELVYQPQFELPERRLIGAEALVRWKSAEHGYIPPGVFVPVAEEINLFGRLGTWVLEKAIGQIIRWNTDYGLNLKMGVNISPKQLAEKSFFAMMKALINRSGVNTAWLDAEITENLMIDEQEKVQPIFNLFEELDISVSIDDFGSGYSSLGYLNRFHFDRIKIDKSLIDNLLLAGGSGTEVVRAIINMASAVGKVTIAEGVESPEQLKILEELGCRQVQGYLFGRPVPAAEFTEKYIIGSKQK